MRPRSNHPNPAFLVAAACAAFLVLGCGETAVTPVTQEPPQFLAAWGSHGNAPGDFDFPADVAVDTRGNVYVTDASLGRVQKFSAAGGFLQAFGEKGSGPGQLRNPLAVAVDAYGFVYVGDHGNYRIQKFGPDGAHAGTWDYDAANFGLAVNARGEILVSGTKILERRADLTPRRQEGPFLYTLSAHGVQRGRDDVHGAGAIALDGFGNVYGVKRFYLDNQPRTSVVMMQNGQVLREWRAEAISGQDIAVAGGSVYLSGNQDFLGYVFKFQPSGHLLSQWRNVDTYGNLSTPVGLAVDTEQTIYVADWNTRLIVKYGYPLPAPR